MSRLTVWYRQTRIGTLSWEPPAWTFCYANEWLAAPERFPLSPHFPFRNEPYFGDSVKWFFQNLLPEGRVLEAIASREGVRRENTFALLARLGRECAGALTIIPEAENIKAAEGKYRKLESHELLSWVRNMGAVPLAIASHDARMSLAGAQEKLAVRVMDDGIYLPEDYSPTTHIVKPENLLQERYPHCVLNEYFCMQLAERMGLPVPQTNILRVDGIAFYQIQRFDRVVQSDGTVIRLHQNDLCQVLDKWPDYKYEELGGASLADYFKALDRYAAKPAPARLTLLRWVIFNFLIGNSDAHAKNVSFLMDGNSLNLAPFYDLLCVKIYGDNRLAASIGQHNQYGWIEQNDWEQFAKECDLEYRLVKRTLLDYAARLPSVAEVLLASLKLETDELDFARGIINVIQEHCGLIHEYIG